MEQVAIITHLWLSIGIGVSLSIDVLFATLSRLHKKDSFFDWAVVVAVLHAFLPALAFTVAWTAGQLHDQANIFVGLIGFTLVALYLNEEFCEKIGRKAKLALVHKLSGKLGVNREKAGVMVLGTGVSIDAFLFGPTFVATMNQQGWNLPATYAAFVIIGLTVFAITLLTLFIPRLFGFLAKRLGLQVTNDVAIVHFWVDLAVFSVIGGFGVLSLWSTTGQETNLAYSILASAVLWSILFGVFRKELMESEFKEAHEIID